MSEENNYPVAGADTDATQTVADESVTQDADIIGDEHPPATKERAEKSGSSLAKVLALIAIVLTLVLSGIGYKAIRSLQSQINAQSDNINDITDVPSMVSFKKNLFERFEKSNEQNDATNKQMDELSKMVADLSQQNNRNQRDWVLAEVDYLMKIAYARLSLLRDVNTATEALKRADASLANLNDPSLMALRKLLANDIVELNVAKKLDSNGTVMRLTALSKIVSRLPTAKAGLASVQEGVADSLAESNDSGEDNSKIDQYVGDLTRWIGFKQLPTTAERNARRSQQMFYIDQLMQLELDAARYSLLRLDEDAYDQHLTTARTLLNQHYQADDEVVQNVSQQLDELMTKKVFPKLPSLSASAAELDRVVARYDLKQDEE